MDTRDKIRSGREAERVVEECGRSGARRAIVAGYFDPLLAAHALRLEEIAAGGGVTVMVCAPEHPLLPARARAELVAALRCVECVLLPDGVAQEQSWRQQIPPPCLVDETGADAARRQELIRHVHRRQEAR